jgi:two-component system nitrate/nitrite response regulator NarL
VEAVAGSQRVTVIVAEDHPIYLEGLVRAIGRQPQLELVGTATTGREALDLIRRCEPTVAVLDINLPDLTGVEVLRTVARDKLPTRVVILTSSDDGELVFEAVRLGVAGYLTKDADRTAICDAILAVARGATVLAPEVQAGLAGALRLHQHDNRPGLSAREREILGLVAQGQSAPEIAAALQLSPATIKTHLHNLYEKLGVSERAAAVAEAMRRGLLE